MSTFCFRFVRGDARLFGYYSADQCGQRARFIFGRPRCVRRDLRPDEIAVCRRRTRWFHGLVVGDRYVYGVALWYRANRATRFAQGYVASGQGGPCDARDGREGYGAVVAQGRVGVDQFVLSSVVRLDGVAQYLLSDSGVLRVAYRARNNLDDRIRADASQRVVGGREGVHYFDGHFVILMGAFLEEFIVVECDGGRNVGSYRVVVFRHFRGDANAIATGPRRGEGASVRSFSCRAFCLIFFFFDRD